MSEFYIFTQPKHCGKSLKLLEWSEGQAPTTVAGFLTPTQGEDKRKVLYDLQTKTTSPFQEPTGSEATPTVQINSYNLSAAAFSKAEEIYARTEGAAIFVVDEVGPLELQGGGHHNLLLRILGEKKIPKILLVVREGLVEEVSSKYFASESTPRVLENLEGFSV
jgi:nucleoside-triphosphatase THEP1